MESIKGEKNFQSKGSAQCAKRMKDGSWYEQVPSLPLVFPGATASVTSVLTTFVVGLMTISQ